MRVHTFVAFAVKTLLVVGLAFAMLVLVEYFDIRIIREAGSGLAAARQKQPPAQTIGQSDELLRTLDLTTELSSAEGRPLRMRRITVRPGGALALHTHVDRPAVTYLLQGEMTYHAEGRPPVVLRAGDGMAEGRATTHWAENTGSVPAVWIAVDIPLAGQ